MIHTATPFQIAANEMIDALDNVGDLSAPSPTESTRIRIALAKLRAELAADLRRAAQPQGDGT